MDSGTRDRTPAPRARRTLLLVLAALAAVAGFAALQGAGRVAGSPTLASDQGVGVGTAATLAAAVAGVAFLATAAGLAVLALRRAPEVQHRVDDAEAEAVARKRDRGVRLVAWALLLPVTHLVLSGLVSLLLVGSPAQPEAPPAEGGVEAPLPPADPSPLRAMARTLAGALALVGIVVWVAAAALLLTGGVILARSRPDPWAPDPEVDGLQDELERAAAADLQRTRAEGTPTVLLETRPMLPWERL